MTDIFYNCTPYLTQSCDVSMMNEYGTRIGVLTQKIRDPLKFLIPLFPTCLKNIIRDCVEIVPLVL